MSWEFFRQKLTNPTEQIQRDQPGYPEDRVKPHLAYVAQDIPEDLERGSPFSLDSEEGRELRGNDLDRGPRDESTDCRGRDKFDQPAEPECAEEKNDNTLGNMGALSEGGWWKPVAPTHKNPSMAEI